MFNEQDVLLEANSFEVKTPQGNKLLCFSKSICSGEILFIYGKNGSGKSTLLKQLFQIATKALKTRDIKFKNSLTISYMPQSFNREFFIPLNLGDVEKLSPNFNENLHLICKDLLSSCLRKLMWNAASGGERQRALLSQALSQDSDLYILDEPFNHLDQVSRDLLIDIMFKMAGMNKAFMITSHIDFTAYHSPRCSSYNVDKVGLMS